MLEKENVAEWYRTNASSFEALAISVVSTLISLLRSRKIDFLAISHRTKSLESLTEKIIRKEYQDLGQITDVAGVRVVAYVETDIPKITEQIREAFHIHEDKSVDKSEELSADKIGYRSVHYVCELGLARTALAELAQFKGLQFEIQVRTVLQHAWAEIEHDRSYKFSGELPAKIQRRLNLLAGVLELVDREFGVLAEDVDQYAARIGKSAKSGALSGEEITSISLRAFLNGSQYAKYFRSNMGDIDEALVELKKFGLERIGDFEQILTPDFITQISTWPKSNSAIGFVRKAMMYFDIDRYFREAWNGHWKTATPNTRLLLTTKYGKKKISSVSDEFDVTFLSESTQ